MPPRPRPRPRANPASDTTTPSAASGSNINVTNITGQGSSQQSARVQSPKEIEDEDALFIRRNRRTKEERARLEKKEEEIEHSRSQTHLASSDNDDDDDEPHPRKRPSRKVRGSSRPEWTKGDHKIIISSSDDEVHVQDDATPNHASRGKMSPNKRKHVSSRSRSRSITPPPELPEDLRAKTRAIIRKALNSDTPARPPSPISSRLHQPDQDNMDLDPELARIAYQVKAGGASTRSTNIHTKTDGKRSEVDVVALQIEWIPHPQQFNGPRNKWTISQGREDKFSHLIKSIAAAMAIPPELVVITYDGRKVYSSATPNILKMFATATLQACATSTYEYMQVEKRARSASVQPQGEDDNDDVAFVDGSGSTPALRSSTPGTTPAPVEEEFGEAKFRLVVRSGTAEVKIAVRPSTKCGTIIKGFVNASKLNVSPAKLAAARVVVDGDRMDNDDPIGDADLEEGDQIEIAGLT